MSLTQTIAFIGAGNMASALIEGLLKAATCSRERIAASDVRADALAALAERHAIRTYDDNLSAARGADVLVLSTKPQILPQVLRELAPAIQSESLIISIAAGVPIAVIEGVLPAGARVVRAMPNTPALVQAGATGIAPGARASDADMQIAETIFRSVGVVERMPEALLDAVTGLSGSGPAYVFYLVEALTAAGVREGLSAAAAGALAAQTVYGAGQLLKASGESPEALRRKVTSPGGTTAAGIAQLEQSGFEAVIAGAVRRATARAHELGVEAEAKLRAASS